MGIFIKSGILHTLKCHLHTLSCHLWLNLWISSKFQLHEWERRLKNFDDKQIIEFLKFGWPLSFEGVLDFCDDMNVTNHKGATEFSQDVDEYINSELREGRIISHLQRQYHCYNVPQYCA